MRYDDIQNYSFIYLLYYIISVKNLQETFELCIAYTDKTKTYTYVLYIYNNKGK